MVQLAIWGPAFISLMIRYSQKRYKEIKKMVIEYGIYSVIITLITQLIISYIFGISEVTQEALTSFSFFTKYVFLEILIALILPLMQKLVEKYIKITFEVGIYDKTEENEISKKDGENN